MKKNMLISLIVGIIVSGGAIYLAFRNVPMKELVSYMGTINYYWILPSAVISLVSFVLRGIRWQIILSSAKEISFWRAFHPLMIGFMLNCILPGRVGEVARPLILQKKDQVPFSTGLATVAGERVFDLAVLITLFATVFASVQISPDLSIVFGKYHLNKETLEMIGGNMIKLTIVLIAGIMMVSFSPTRRVINAGIMGVPSLFFFTDDSFKTKLREKLCTALVGIVENFASGFSLVKSPKKMGLCIVFSLLIWGIQAFSYYIFSLACPGIGLSYLEITAVMLIICFFIALPSVPGFWGLWEAGGMFALALFGISSKHAAGFTLTNHAIQIFPVIIAGLISALITGVNIWQVAGRK